MAFELGRTLLYHNDPTSLPLGMLGLDAVISTTFLLTFIHAAKNGISRVALFLALFVVALIVEESSINNGYVTTHCHGEATVMITKCSSLNSVMFYVPWLYTSMMSAKRLGLPWWAYPSAAGLLQMLYGLPYEIQGPAFGWWKYTDQDIANGALTERVFGMPLMAAYFHPAMGWGVAAAEVLSGFSTTPSLLSWLGLVFLSAPSALLLDGPVRVLNAFSVSKHASVPLLLLTIFAFPLILALPGRLNGGARKTSSDVLLFLVPLVWACYFLSVKFWDEFRGPIKHDEDLTAIVFFCALASVVLHASIDFGSPRLKAE